MVKFKNRVINWQIRCNTQWQKALPWGTMITGIFIFHYNTIIPLKKVSDSFELDTFLETVLIQLFHSPLGAISDAGWPAFLIAGSPVLMTPSVSIEIRGAAAREALIKSLSDFILGFLCNARNNSTQIASYLRQQSCIGLLSQDKLIGQPLKGKRFNGQAKRQSAAGLQVLCRTCTLSLHIKAPSFYSWPSYDEAVHKNPYEI